MGCMLSCLGSCAGAAAGSACCSAGKVSVKTSRGSKVFHLLIVFLAAVIALLFRFQLHATLDSAGGVVGNRFKKICTNTFPECDNDSQCIGLHAALRVCIALFAFFLMTAVGCAASPTFHYGFVGVKFLVWLVLTVGAMFLPNAFADGFAAFAMFGAAAFLLLQVLTIVSSAYNWNDRWASKGGNAWLIAILVVCLVIWALDITLTGYLYTWFAPNRDCVSQTTLITMNFVIGIVLTGLSVSPVAPHGSILTSSCLAGYIMFVTFSALSADPSSCNTRKNDDASDIIGLVIGAIVMTYRAFSTSRASLFGPTNDETEKGVDQDDDDVESEGADGDDGDEKNDPVEGRWDAMLFYALLALSSLYLMMSISQFQIGHDSATASAAKFGISKDVMWVNIGVTWATAALYLWTLTAPRLLPGRDFGVDFDD